MASDWSQLAAQKRDRISKSIPSEWKLKNIDKQRSAFESIDDTGLLSPDELKIVKSSATDLVQKLARGDLKSLDVTLAFCKRAASAHELVRSSPFPRLFL